MLFIGSHATIVMHHILTRQKGNWKQELQSIRRILIKNQALQVSYLIIGFHLIITLIETRLEQVKILDREPSYNKRLTSEMIFIKRQKNGLNLQSDTKSLPEIYSPVIQALSPFWMFPVIFSLFFQLSHHSRWMIFFVTWYCISLK